MTCNVCCKTMRGDQLKRHMKVHVMEIGNVVENTYEAGTNRSVTSSVKCTNVNLEFAKLDLEKMQEKHFILLGKNIQQILICSY